MYNIKIDNIYEISNGIVWWNSTSTVTYFKYFLYELSVIVKLKVPKQIKIKFKSVDKWKSSTN